MKTIGIIFAAVIGILVLGWAFGWIATPLSTTSSGNVREQWRAGYENYEALKATAINHCAAKQAVMASTEPYIAEQRRTQEIAQQQNYTRIAAQYNAAMRDGFRARFVKPGDLPAEAPSLEAMELGSCSAP